MKKESIIARLVDLRARAAWYTPNDTNTILSNVIEDIKKLNAVVNDPNKPSWKDAPTWANWLCMDLDNIHGIKGVWYWYQSKPKHGNCVWYNDGQYTLANKVMYSDNAVNKNWIDTLEERPADRIVLKPCPFCGSDGTIEKLSNGQYYPICDRSAGLFCLLNREPILGTDGFKYQVDAVMFWNNRK